MTNDVSDEIFSEERVTYTLQAGDRFFVIENVPARISQRTGERFFSPETVQAIIWRKGTPVRDLETPVFQFVK